MFQKQLGNHYPNINASIWGRHFWIKCLVINKANKIEGKTSIHSFGCMPPSLQVRKMQVSESVFYTSWRDPYQGQTFKWSLQDSNLTLMSVSHNQLCHAATVLHRPQHTPLTCSFIVLCKYVIAAVTCKIGTK